MFCSLMHSALDRVRCTETHKEMIESTVASVLVRCREFKKHLRFDLHNLSFVQYRRTIKIFSEYIV